jgi:hypothetical protein
MPLFYLTLFFCHQALLKPSLRAGPQSHGYFL